MNVNGTTSTAVATRSRRLSATAFARPCAPTIAQGFSFAAASTERVKNVDKLVSRTEAANILGVKPQTLATWHITGRYKLPLVKVGRSVRYRVTDLERWVQSRTIGASIDDCGGADAA